MSTDSEQSPATVLRIAAYNGDLETVRRLVLEAVDVNVADQWGRTALSLAARQGHEDMVSYLIEAGAWIDPHEDYDTYESPLSASASRGHLKIVRLLVEAGANPSFHVGVSQGTAEFYARVNGHLEVSAYLRKIMG